MLRKALWILAGVLVLIQFIRPGMNNPPIDRANDYLAVAHPPAEVGDLIKEACYDCHSNETRHPWYAQVAPVSWWIANHVIEGREHLNFSDYGLLSPGDVAELMDEAAETIQEGEMPLPSYTWFGLHPGARLSAAQREQLAAWFSANGGGGEGGHTAEDEDED